MKTASPTLVALLATGEFVTADLYTITLAGGGVIRLTTADTNVKWGADTYVAGTPLIDTTDTEALARLTTGLDVDTWTFAVIPRTIDTITGAAHPDKIGSQPWAAAAAAGALDGATVQVDRAYWSAWPTPWVTPLVPAAVLESEFFGRVADVDFRGVKVLISVNSWLELLAQPMPREVFQASCRHTLFGAGCTLSAAAFGVNGTASSATSGASLASAVAAPSGSGTYTMGRVVFTAGLNAGFARAVRSWTPGLFSLMAPFPYPISAGDAFTAYPGCDKSRTTCALFSNSLNFGGTPLIPAPETVL